MTTRIVIVGPPGAEVVAVGKLLAAQQRQTMISVDDLVTARTNTSISDLVLSVEESQLRALQQEAVNEFVGGVRAASVGDAPAAVSSGCAPCVLVVTSGAEEDQQVRSQLRTWADHIVMLELPTYEAARRAGLGAASTPALGPTRATWKTLFAARMSVLRALADFVVDGADEPARIVEQISTRLRPTVQVGALRLGGSRQARIVAPLFAADLNQVAAQMEQIHHSGADLLEWRVDAMRDLDPHQISQWATQIRELAGQLPVLATVRTEGTRLREPDEYLNAYRALLSDVAGPRLVDAVDVELLRMTSDSSVKAVQELAAANGVPVIGSHHRFDGTPPVPELLEIMQTLAASGADIVKLATTAHTPADVLNLLTATYEMASRLDRPLMTMAMGQTGVASRLVGAVFGSVATFATAGVGSAPGQPPVAVVRQMFAELFEDRQL